MTRKAPTDRRRGREREPLSITLSVTVRTGPEPADRYDLMRDRELRLARNVFFYRDRIMRYFVGALWRVALASPKVYREIAPGLAAMRDKRRDRTT